MNVYHFIQRNKSDGLINNVFKRRLDKTREEILGMIEKNDSPEIRFTHELIEDEKMIELADYAISMQSNSDLDDVLNQLSDIENMIHNYIDSKK